MIGSGAAADQLAVGCPIARCRTCSRRVTDFNTVLAASGMTRAPSSPCMVHEASACPGAKPRVLIGDILTGRGVPFLKHGRRRMSSGSTRTSGARRWNGSTPGGWHDVCQQDSHGIFSAAMGASIKEWLAA